jgi:thioredoxin reductase (NADPH)
VVKKLIETGRKQAERFGTKIKFGEAVGIFPTERGFKVNTFRESFEGKFVVLAIGSRRKRVSIEGLEKFIGAGVSFCAICDAPFFKGKIVGIVGNVDYTIHEGLELLKHASKVYLLTNGIRPQFSKNMKKHLNKFENIEKRIKKVIGKEKVEGIEFDDHSTLTLDGLFIALDPSSSESLARKLGIRLEKDLIVVDENKKTDVSGLYAVGDCVNKDKQIGLAVADGIKAALSIIRELKGVPKMH